MNIALVVGTVFAVAVGVFATAVGLDRDRAFYPTVMIAIALLYVLFAAIGGSRDALVVESLVAVAFIAAAVVGFRSSLWVAAGALAAHGIFDLAHDGLITNPGVPAWWRDFCSTYDVAAAVYLARLLKTKRLKSP